MHLLDTDTLSHLFAGNQRVAERMAFCRETEIATTIVTKAEMLRGRIDFLLKAATRDDVLRAQSLLWRTEELLSAIRVVSSDSNA